MCSVDQPVEVIGHVTTVINSNANDHFRRKWGRRHGTRKELASREIMCFFFLFRARSKSDSLTVSLRRHEQRKPSYTDIIWQWRNSNGKNVLCPNKIFQNFGPMMTTGLSILKSEETGQNWIADRCQWTTVTESDDEHPIRLRLKTCIFFDRSVDAIRCENSDCC